MKSKPRARNVPDSEDDSDELKPKYKKKKRKSKLRKFKRCSFVVVAVRKMLRARYRKRKMKNFSKSLLSGLCFQTPDLGTDSGYETAGQKGNNVTLGKQNLFQIIAVKQSKKKSKKAISKRVSDSDPQGEIFKGMDNFSTKKGSEYRNFSNIIPRKRKKQREVPKITLQYLKQCVLFTSTH